MALNLDITNEYIIFDTIKRGAYEMTCYLNDSGVFAPAVDIVDFQDGPWATVTVNLDDYRVPRTERDIMVRSEYKDVIGSMEEHGIVVPVDTEREEVPYGPFDSYAIRCTLTDEALEAAKTYRDSCDD